MNTPDMLSASHSDLFNFVIQKLLEQDGPAMKKTFSGTFCAYRAENGRKCGIGHIISDEDYSDTFEMANAASIYDVIVLKKIGAGKEYTREEKRGYFLQRLQQIHDRNADLGFSETNQLWQSKPQLALSAINFAKDEGITPSPFIREWADRALM